MAFQSLPPEIICLIVAFFPNTPDRLVDLVQLSLVCHNFHAVANRELYRRAVQMDQVLGPGIAPPGLDVYDKYSPRPCPWEWPLRWHRDLRASARRVWVDNLQTPWNHHVPAWVRAQWQFDQRNYQRLQEDDNTFAEANMLLPVLSSTSLAARGASPPPAGKSHAANDLDTQTQLLPRSVPPPIVLVAATTNNVGLLDRLLRLGLGFDRTNRQLQTDKAVAAAIAATNCRVLHYLTATYYQPLPYHRELSPWKHVFSATSCGAATEDNSDDKEWRPEHDPTLEINQLGRPALYSPLHLAAQYGNQEFVSVLLQTIGSVAAAAAAGPASSSAPPLWWLETRARGANFGASRHLALALYECSRGSALHAVYEWPAATALHLALAHGHTAIAAQLIEAGANWDRAIGGAWGVSGLALIAANGHVGLVEWLLAREQGRKSNEERKRLVRACCYRDLPDQKGFYALHYACLAPLPDEDNTTDADDKNNYNMGRLVRGLVRLGAVTSETPASLRRRAANASNPLPRTWTTWPKTDFKDGMQHMFSPDSDPSWLVEFEPISNRVFPRLTEQGPRVYAAEHRPVVVRVLEGIRSRDLM